MFRPGSSQYPGDSEDFETYINRFRTKDHRKQHDIPPLLIEQQLDPDPHDDLITFIPTNEELLNAVSCAPSYVHAYVLRVIDLNVNWYVIHTVATVNGRKEWASTYNFYNYAANRKYFVGLLGSKVGGHFRLDLYFIYKRISPTSYMVYAVQLACVTDVPRESSLVDYVDVTAQEVSFRFGGNSRLAGQRFTTEYLRIPPTSQRSICSPSSSFVVLLVRSLCSLPLGLLAVFLLSVSLGPTVTTLTHTSAPMVVL